MAKEGSEVVAMRDLGTHIKSTQFGSPTGRGQSGNLSGEEKMRKILLTITFITTVILTVVMKTMMMTLVLFTVITQTRGALLSGDVMKRRR